MAVQLESSAAWNVSGDAKRMSVGATVGVGRLRTSPVSLRIALRTFDRSILHDGLPLGIDYGGLVVSPACFARAESRSSLNPDSFSPPRFCRADVSSTLA